MTQFKAISRMLKDVANSIEWKWPGRRIVVLGRDGWPLVPMLRSMGMECQYFLWSRISSTGATYQTWKREVMPGSVVIDTGFAGSIFDRILRCGNEEYMGLSFGLISSSGRYDQIGNGDYEGMSLRETVLALEHMPKLTDRHVSFDRSDCAEYDSARNDEEEEIASFDAITQNNYTLLRECGLSHDVSQEWSTFTGSTMEERLGISGDELTAYLLSVALKRAKIDHKIDRLQEIAQRRAIERKDGLTALQEKRERIFDLAEQIAHVWANEDEDCVVSHGEVSNLIGRFKKLLWADPHRADFVAKCANQVAYTYGRKVWSHTVSVKYQVEYLLMMKRSSLNWLFSSSSVDC